MCVRECFASVRLCMLAHVCVRARACASMVTCLRASTSVLFSLVRADVRVCECAYLSVHVRV